jgi:GT2 family glycosyltransferase
LVSLLPIVCLKAVSYINEAEQNPKVSVIILNYNRPELTLDCVNSVLNSTYKNLEVIIVDNCSEIQSFSYLKTKIDQLPVTLFRTKTNSGYAGGNNAGILYSTGKYVLLLNDDILVDNQMIAGLVALITQNCKIGVIGPLTYYPESTKLWYYPDEILKSKREVIDVPIVIGAAFLILRSVIREIGLLDENFFMYHEEWDWCFRARTAGYKVVCAPRLRVWHRVKKANYYAKHFAYFYHQNYFLFARKNLGSFKDSIVFLFNHLVWSKADGLYLYPVLALKNGHIDAFKAYFRGVIKGMAIYLMMR